MVWVVFAVVVRFVVVGFGLLMIFLVGSNVWLNGFGFLGFFFFLWVSWPAVVFGGGGGFVLGLWVFFSLGLVAGGGGGI